MDVGKEIRRLREARGWSQAKLAGASGMGTSGISQIETGARNPSAATLSKIADALGVEVRDLFPLGQAPLPDFEQERQFDAWKATLEHYKSLRMQLSGFEELGRQEQVVLLNESLLLYQDLRQAYNPANLELALLHDLLYHAILRMLAVCELEQERGGAEADVVDIEEYRARLRQSA